MHTMVLHKLRENQYTVFDYYRLLFVIVIVIVYKKQQQQSIRLKPQRLHDLGE